MSNAKLLLSEIRDGDFTHPGDIEAIKIAFRNLHPNVDRQILDVGCGLGGTANYLYKNNYGNVMGIDIDSGLIDFAQNKYPYINFETLAAEKAASRFNKCAFNLVYFFSSMYCMENKNQVINSVKSLIKPGGYLIIFDYIQGEYYQGENPFSDKSSKVFQPLSFLTMKQSLSRNGWQIENLEDISQNFLIWYENIISKLTQNKRYLSGQYSDRCFNKVYSRFSTLVSLIRSNKIGGGTIMAKKYGEK